MPKRVVITSAKNICHPEREITPVILSERSESKDLILPQLATDH
jgi:hypothetical protein